MVARTGGGRRWGARKADLRWWEADLAGFLYCFERLPSQPEHVQASS